MSETLPPLRLCPRCKITMQAERSQPSDGGYDTFTCLRCDLVLTYKRSPSRNSARKPGSEPRVPRPVL